MALFRTRNLSLNAKPLFTTVNDKKETILTSGTYIIGRLDRKTEEQLVAEKEEDVKPQPIRKNYVEVFKSTYSQGTAPTNEIFNPETDTVFIYPDGYFGTSGTGDVRLENPFKIIEVNKNKQVEYINSKIKPE
jgi:hypothetical protein